VLPSGVFFQPENVPKLFSAMAYDAQPDPLVGWRGGHPSVFPSFGILVALFDPNTNS